MFDISGYERVSFPVRCQTGVTADAADGRRMIFDEAAGRYIVPSDVPTQKVNKKTLKTYRTFAFELEPDRLRFYVLSASEINKHGLVWQVEFEDALLPKSREPELHSRQELLGWLTGAGAASLICDILIPKGGSVTPEACLNAFRHKPAIPEHLKLMPMRLFAAEWLSEGGIDKYFNPSEALKNQKFGIEVEFTGMTRSEAAKTIAKYFGTEAKYVGTGYHTYAVKDGKGRTWSIMKDASINPCTRFYGPAGDDYKCELVTPLCCYGDIPDIQQIIRELRHAGMRVNDSCGIHVHVDDAGHTAKSLKNLVNIMANREEMLFKALGTYPSRNQWCRRVDRHFLDDVQLVGGRSSIETVRALWYHGRDRSVFHYDYSRYHALNLHSLWQGKGIEFRMFNSVTHAGKVKAYIQLCLAISNQAKSQSWVSYRTKKTTHEKRQFRTWLTQMGLVGEEFATARLHLLANLKDEGSNAA